MERSLRAYLLPALAYLIVLELMLAAAIWWWPNFRDNVGALQALTPKSLRHVVDKFADGAASTYVIGQHFMKGCSALGMAAAVLFSVGAVAGEAHRGTLEIWLARPVSRHRLLFERWLAGAVALVLPVFLTSLTIPWMLAWHDERMDVSDLLRCSAHESAFLLSVYSATFLASTLSSQPLKIAVWVLFLAVLQVAIYLVHTITHWSLMRLADLEVFHTILRTNAFDWPLFGGLLAASALLLGAAHFAFARRVP